MHEDAISQIKSQPNPYDKESQEITDMLNFLSIETGISYDIILNMLKIQHDYCIDRIIKHIETLPEKEVVIIPPEEIEKEKKMEVAIKNILGQK